MKLSPAYFYPRISLTLATLVILGSLHPATAPAASKAQPWLSPATLTVSADKSALFVTCATANRILEFNLGSATVSRSWDVPQTPTGAALSPDGKTLAVTCAGSESEICLIDLGRGKMSGKFSAGHTTTAPVFSPDGKKLYVCNRFNDDVAVFEIGSGKQLARIPVKREPVAAALTRDGKHLLVANHLPSGPANIKHVASVLSVIDTASMKVVDELWLPSGSTGLNAISISPDGRFAVVSHILARYHLPTTQLDRGWVNTNAKTLIALDPIAVVNTVLLDNVDRGAANPWGCAWGDDGKTLAITHAGTHEVSVINFPGVLDKLKKQTPQAVPPASNLYPIWGKSGDSQVPNDLAFLVDLRQRVPLPENDLGPRGVAIVGNRVYTANYFSDTISVLDLADCNAPVRSLPLGPKPVMTPVRQGELAFNDARICFQGWQSCASCHPGDARVDGLNWDLLNDGIGNPKNNKSLLLSHRTPPAMSLAARDTAEAAVRAGINFILFTVQPPEVAESLDAYLISLRPVPSPRLVKGKLSPAAWRGEKLFSSKEVGCASCHPGPLFTDLQLYDVGTAGEFDREARSFDTPTLVELWRTAPYLHDGSAATMRDLLTDKNKGDLHGKTSHLSADQILDLCEYLLSL